MGRGRQKAKQTKVARELKYQNREIDTAALQRELAGPPVNGHGPADDDDSEDDEYPGYASYLSPEDEDDGYQPARAHR